MRKIYKLLSLLLLIIISGTTVQVNAQTKHAKPGMGEGKFNYTTFTEIIADKSPETIAGNADALNDAELGKLFKEAPCKNCYEAIGKRTERTKTYITKQKEGKEILTQTSTQPMHYMGTDKRWHTIQSRLQPQHNSGVFAATEQEAPITVNTEMGYSSLGKTGQIIQFNNRLELLYELPDGTTTSLGNASWQHYTAGDDGVYVTNAWPGIDIEMRTARGAVKTNFWINHSLPAYTGGKLLIRDHLHLDNGLSLFSGMQKHFTGVLQIKNEQQESIYMISTATAFEKNDGEKTLRNLEYVIGDNNTLDIAVPGDFLDRPATSYPVIIDPLVSLATSITVPGSTYSPGWTVGCPTVNPATVPADVTITDIQFSFEYLASGGALQTNGAMDFYLGACRNPALTGWYWYCLTFTPGTCGGTDISLISDYAACIPPVNCLSYNLNITMNLYQSYLSAAPCSNLYITATQPYIITVVGQVLNTTLNTPAPICPGGSATMASTTTYGKAPYTYSWSPGGYTTAGVTVSPATTTTYTMIVTDACGFSDTATSTVTVNPSSPITGTTSLCAGTTTTLSNAIAGGTWVSGNTAVATISATGIVSAVGAGTTTISYTTAAGCLSTVLFTVVTSTDPIAGSSTLCTGASMSLTNTSPGGTWSSSNTTIASINSTTGITTGIAAGTVVITYSLSAGCYSTFPVAILASPNITGTSSADPTTCTSLDGSITLTGLTPGDAYTVNYLFNGTPATAGITANALGNVIITGLDGGSYTNITVTNASGCISNTVIGPIALNFPPSPAAPVAGNSGPICAGDNINLTALSSTPGVTYNWTGPNGFTSTVQNPTIIPAYTVNAGTYVVTATIIGCVSAPSTTLVVVHPVPFITGTTFTPPTTCFGSDGTITLAGLLAGVSYTVTYNANGNPVTATIVGDISGNVVITGLSAGVYSGISMSSFGCISNTAETVTLLDPGAPPIPTITSNGPVCEGTTLALFATSTMPGVTYAWSGPNGFTSTLQNPTIPNVTPAAAGTYVATVSNGPCSTSGSTAISLYPALVLTNITPDQSVIFGTTIQLTASGATYYTWSPDDGTLNNANIRNPVARPMANTTYIVSGMNEWGCVDTAWVNITIEHTDTVLIPTAFTPNGDGYNDIFRVANSKDCKLVEFSVYNRWGQTVYHNTWDITRGWDGSFNGVPMDMGVYNYIIILARPNGDNIIYKGDVTLIK